MPEGDTIHRTASRLQGVMNGATVLRSEGSTRFVDADSLMGAVVERVEAKGKHLLMFLDDKRVLHSHLGMTGSWHVYQPAQRWRKPPRLARLRIDVRRHELRSTVVCFTPKTLELLSATQYRRHGHLNRLGPDLMLPQLPSADLLLPRFRVHNRAPVGEAIMNQTIVSGVGNVYKSETLFLSNINPFRPIQNLNDTQLLEIVNLAHELMRQNRTGYPRQTRYDKDGPLLWVYGRQHEPCIRCSDPIQMRRQGDLGRSTYWCPTCQDTGS